MTEFQPFSRLKGSTGDSSESNQLPALLFLPRSVIFGLITAAIGFPAIRNTLTWHLQRFWDASGDFWQTQWDNVLDIFGEDPYTYWVYGSFFLTTLVYWGIGGIYTFLDITNKPAALRRYKIQPGTNEPVETKRLVQVIMTVLFNQFVINTSMLYLFYKLMQKRGLAPMRELPTFQWMLAELVVIVLIEEFGFYYSHRLLHNRHLYRIIHKKHHEWTAPIAVTAMYCHPVEHIISNVLPLLLGVLVMGSHIATAYLWFTLAVIGTLSTHSGYKFLFFPSSELHDFHHLKFVECFGLLGMLDRLHGTDKMFRKTQAVRSRKGAT